MTKNNNRLEEIIKRTLPKKGIRHDFLDIPVEELIEELNVYYHELEMQNEELSRIRNDLEKSEKHFFDLYQNAPIGYVTFNAEMKILSVNRFFAEKTGIDFKNSNFYFSQFVAPESQDDLYFHVKLLKETGEPQTAVLEIICGHVKCTAKVSSNIEFEQQGFVVRSALIDVTMENSLFEKHKEMINKLELEKIQREKIEKENQRLVELYIRKEKLDSLGVLAGGIAHDLNNLLSGIFGYMEMASLRIRKDPDKAETYLEKATKLFENAKNLSNSLLTFSKGGDPVKKVSDIGEIVTKSVEFSLAGSEVKPEINIDKDLKCTKIDENQMSQVIGNIVINARQAMCEKGNIRVSVKNVLIENEYAPFITKGEFIKISITDEGVGIPKEFLKKIFDPFYTTKHNGNGLGLATSYSIILKHRGHIDVESEEGTGSTFNIFLPVCSGEEVYLNNNKINSDEKNLEGKVLVMDDQESVREIIGDMLNKMGLKVEFCVDGTSAISCLKESFEKNEPFDIAILDLTIPGGKGGVETAKELSESDFNIPLIASSGYSDDPVISEPGKFGFAASIRKPFKHNDLYSLLKKFINQ
jgi:signal transduction histidine kinase/ActR/RegA family two-component response regulator